MDTLIEVPVKQNDLINLWMNLNKNNICTISKDYDLRDKTGNEINLAIHDGISFHFELLNTKSKRSYFYHCPKGHSEEYKYIKEYKWVTNIVELIFTYCGINRNYIC